jgi:hypothetical protein
VTERRPPTRTATGHAAQPPARGQGDILLLWARDGAGAKVRADRLAAKDRRGRAPFTCLGCGEPLVPHLGKIRAPHFAHLPGSRCPLTAPETALHLDAKERLLALCRDAFAGVRRVAVIARCPSCRRAQPIDLAARGDAAVDEGAVGPLRADVLVTRGGRPALAIEVKVTHAVEPEKEAALAAVDVPFVELDAREEWERPLPRPAPRGIGDPGTGDVPDGVEVVTVRSGGMPPCPDCAALARADAERAKGGEAAEIAELEAYRARGLFGKVEATPRPAGGLAAALAGFRCPDCGSQGLLLGVALAKHACPDRSPRPVAWLSYGAEIVKLGWWRRPESPTSGRKRPE